MPRKNSLPDQVVSLSNVGDDLARENALAMSLGQLTKQLDQLVSEAARNSIRALALREVAAEALPNNTDSDHSDAALWALERILLEAGHRLCTMTGFCEAMLMRLEQSERQAEAEANHVA